MTKPLSKKMCVELLALMESQTIRKADKATMKGLTSRGLLDEEQRLTPLGRIMAIQNLPLNKQCQALTIDLNYLNWDSSLSSPECYAYSWFAQHGYIGSYCEGGGFGTAIKALCLDELEKNSIFYGTFINAREDVCLKGVVSLSHIDKKRLDGIFNEILKTNKTKYLESFSEIISYSAIREWYPGLNLEFAEALFDAVPKDDFRKIAHWISLDHSHRNGWPDLTLIKDGNLKFVEVKTTDKLHFSQLVTIPKLISEINANVSVLQLLSYSN